MLIDTHCHLDKLDLTPYNENVKGALDAAANNGVKQILTISVDLASFSNVHEFTRQSGVFSSCGVHPLHTEGLLDDAERLIQLASLEKVVAIGETGLDYFYEKDLAVHAAQQKSFALHLESAAKLKLPVIVHTREAREDTLALIREHGDTDVGGVLHCFTESYEMAAKALDENYLISISGIVTFKNAAELRETVKKLPLDRLLVETDSPYLAPIPHRGQKNEPKYVKDVAQFVADVKGVRYEELLEITARNFHEKFRKVIRDEVLIESC
ncbi:YchF/TatD family DNA exonuclease [Marinomonas mediterranea]|uniref:TatD family hydrolase n=1 Tax=Marinomonas mediterranea TaxID=119864 RepID=UPI00234BA662|nr:TatD family hydrolase [Marinomonas mediterranea]WCN13570.1 YchF/TatD family DNA exonuclease [Marinomonas mediterranea]